MESKYKDIFKEKTMAVLDAKSKESLRSFLGNKSIMQALVSSQQLISDIVEAEADYKEELEEVAIHMVTDMYPVITYASIAIEAKIVEMGMFENLDNYKRRVINGITQGASVRGAYGFYLFREYLDQINPELVEKYKEIMHNTFGAYDSPEVVAMSLQLIAAGHKVQGGSSEVEWTNINESAGAPVIKVKASAICFPMLIHEIIKGLHEILSLQGFGPDADLNQKVVDDEDTLPAELHDLKYGKFIYDEINSLYQEANIEDARVRELFLAELYKLANVDFLSFIENIINNELTSQQKNWALREMQNIERDLKADDAGIELDEIKIVPFRFKVYIERFPDGIKREYILFHDVKLKVLSNIGCIIFTKSTIHLMDDFEAFLNEKNIKHNKKIQRDQGVIGIFLSLFSKQYKDGEINEIKIIKKKLKAISISKTKNR